MNRYTTHFDYIDIAKGLGILAVTWAHIMIGGWSHKVIYAFHMPLFFLLSGMLFRRDKYNSFVSFIRKRAKRLLMPYVLYSVATWGIWALFRFLRHDQVDSYLSPLLQTFIAQGSGEFMVHNSALWFIPCLFVVELMYWAISKLKDWQNILLCFFLAGLSFLFGYLCGSEYWFLLPYNFDAALIALPFYSVGNIAVKHHSHNEMVSFVNDYRLLSWGLLVLSSIILIAGALSFGECSMGSSSYQCNGGLFLIRAFVGCFAIILFSILISPNSEQIAAQRLLIWYGKNSLDVMCLHIPIKGVIMLIIAKLLSTEINYLSSHWGGAFATFVVTMICVSVVIQFINRYIRK